MEIFQWHTEAREGGVTVSLIGELDLAAADGLDQELKRVEATSPDEIVVDLRRLRFLDSTGLRILTAANRRAQEAGVALRVVRGPGPVQRVFEITGLDAHFQLVDASDG